MGERRILTRKLNKNEYRTLIANMTEGYMDYPVFKKLSKDENKRRELIYWHLFARNYADIDKFYVNDDLTACVCITQPGNKGNSGSLLQMLKEPQVINEIKLLTPRIISMLISYAVLHAKSLKGKYDKNKDYFVESLWLDSSMRGFKNFEILADDVFNKIITEKTKVFFETDGKSRIRLYRRYGAEIVSESEWKGEAHALMCYDKAKQQDE